MTEGGILISRNPHPDRDILSRLEKRQRPAIFGFEIEGGDHFTLLHLAIHCEFPEPVPAAGLFAGGFIHPLFHLDEDAGDGVVGLFPGIDHLIRGRLSQHIPDRPQKILPDDGVMFRADSQRPVFMGNPFHHRQNLLQAVDMGRRRIHRIRQCLGLFPFPLVGAVENVVQFGVAGKQPFVELTGDHGTLFFQYRSGAPDDFHCFWIQHDLRPLIFD